MTASPLTGNHPYRVCLPPGVVSAQTFSFPTPEDRDLFLESWAGVRENLGERLPAEGVDYELINHEGN